jgi:hypothetical protein
MPATPEGKQGSASFLKKEPPAELHPEEPQPK